MKKKFSRILGVGLALAMLTSLLVVAVPALANVSQASVGVTPTTISASANYTVTFDVIEEVPSDGTGYIKVVFPTGTDATGLTALGDVNIQSTAGFGTKNDPTDIPSANVTVDTDKRTVTINTVALTHNIGEDASVRIKFGNVKVVNPPAAGTYTLTVATSEETIAVTSSSYTITTPYIGPLEGIVSVYNPADVLMAQYTGDSCINSAIGAAGKDYTIKIGPGTYDMDAPNTPASGITFMATGTAAETIIKANWTIDEASTVLDGLTLQGTLTINDTVTATTVTTPIVIQNCVLSNAAAVAYPPGAPEILITTQAGYVTIQDNTFDTSNGAQADQAIIASAGKVTISGNSFTVDANTTGTNDTAIQSTGSAELTVSGCTITGASGYGYEATSAAGSSKATITGSTFDGLSKAVLMSANATLTLQSCAVRNSTNPAPTVYGSAIDINWAGSQVLIVNNDIENNAGYSVDVAANAGNVTANGNYMSGNVKGFRNTDTSASVNAKLNWWGDASGPTHVTNLAGTGDIVSDYVSFRPFATTTVSEVATATLSAAGTIDRSTTVGISFTSTAACGEVTLARYSANPAISSPPYAALVDGYYDVYAPDAAGSITILLYNTGIKSDTVAYYFSTLSQKWTKCGTQAVAGNNAYVIVTVGTDPMVSELGGTPFALVTLPPAPVVTITSPDIGTYDIPVSPMFTWDAVPGALRYELTLSEDPTFAIIEWSYNVDDNFYKATDDLRYSTTYYWRVRALTGEPYQVGPAWVTPSGPWSTGIFTTMAEPVPPAEEGPTEITVETPTVTVTPGDVTVDVAPVVPDYLLWTIVGIGAVLIIALIVLIVRTRRVA